jgi:hypothetical protein
MKRTARHSPLPPDPVSLPTGSPMPARSSVITIVSPLPARSSVISAVSPLPARHVVTIGSPLPPDTPLAISQTAARQPAERHDADPAAAR